MLSDTRTSPRPANGHFRSTQLQLFAIGCDKYIALPTEKVGHNPAIPHSAESADSPQNSTYVPNPRIGLYSSP